MRGFLNEEELPVFYRRPEEAAGRGGDTFAGPARIE
jgi:hypothetical protein